MTAVGGPTGKSEGFALEGTDVKAAAAAAKKAYKSGQGAAAVFSAIVHFSSGLDKAGAVRFLAMLDKGMMQKLRDAQLSGSSSVTFALAQITQLVQNFASASNETVTSRDNRERASALKRLLPLLETISGPDGGTEEAQGAIAQLFTSIKGTTPNLDVRQEELEGEIAQSGDATVLAARQGDLNAEFKAEKMNSEIRPARVRGFPTTDDYRQDLQRKLADAGSDIRWKLKYLLTQQLVNEEYSNPRAVRGRLTVISDELSKLTLPTELINRHRALYALAQQKARKGLDALPLICDVLRYSKKHCGPMMQKALAAEAQASLKSLVVAAEKAEVADAHVNSSLWNTVFKAHSTFQPIIDAVRLLSPGPHRPPYYGDDRIFYEAAERAFLLLKTLGKR